MTMGTLVILRPWWLLALAVIAVLAVWLWRTRSAAGGWGAVMPPAMRAAMLRLGHLDDGGGRRSGLAAAGAAALVAAGLAGPALPRTDAPPLAGAGAVMIAIDLSPSVAEGPALADAKAAAAAVLAAAAGRPVGLILYAGEAFAVAAPTADPAVLESDVAVLGPDTMPAEGSRPAAALALAREMLAGSDGADLVLVSDGGGIDAAAATEAERLEAAGIRLSALTLSDPAGPPADVDALVAMADAAAPARAPDVVIDGLAGGAAPAHDPALTALQFHDLGPLVAALAMLPMLALFRRRG